MRVFLVLGRHGVRAIPRGVNPSQLNSGFRVTKGNDRYKCK